MPTQQEQIDYLLKEVEKLKDADCGCEDCGDNGGGGVTPTNQDNLSRTIEVNLNDLPTEGTLEERVVEYVNDLGFDKQETDADIWVSVIEDTLEPAITLNRFSISTPIIDPCQGGLTMPALVAYHDGLGIGPTIGDRVFQDAEGNEPYPDGAYVASDGMRAYGIRVFNGALILFTCRR